VSSALTQIQAALERLARYDDESIVHDVWIRQRYTGGYAATYTPARTAAVITAWHEAGHAAAALALGVKFSSASIRQGPVSEGRVHKIAAASGHEAFVIDAAGQVAEGLRSWTLPSSDAEVSAFLAGWRSDGGDARRFRAAAAAAGLDQAAAWQHTVSVLTPLRLRIRHLARALLVHPAFLRYDVARALYESQ
jgi:hypothetical protein